MFINPRNTLATKLVVCVRKYVVTIISRSSENSPAMAENESKDDFFDVEVFLRSAIKGNSEKSCTYFAGAGISIDSGLPNFLTFGQNILKHIIGQSEGVMSDEDIRRVLSLIRPEILLQTLHKTFGDELLQFTEYLTGETPNPAHEMLATALTKGHVVSHCQNVFFKTS